MNYEDEDYVRYYTRETVGWKALGWEGQTVLALMLHGKFDRSGVFDCDGHDPSHAVTLVTGAPEEVVTAGLARLLKAGTWIYRDGKLVWPKFIHAQTCRRSDKARQRESRENRRAAALGEGVTRGDQPSQPVTNSSPPVTAGDEQSQPVTPSLAEPSRAEISPTPLAPVTPKPEPAPATPGPAKRKDPMGYLDGNAVTQRPDVIRLHAAWKETFRFTGHKFRGYNDLDAQTLADALDQHGEDRCHLVLQNAPNDGMVSGRDDEKRVKHESIAYIFGNAQAFARILRAAEEAERATNGSSSIAAKFAALEAR